MSILLAQHPAGKLPRGALTAGSLCSGYGGLDLAVMAVIGARLAWTAETDQYAAAVLARHWPDVPNQSPQVHRFRRACRYQLRGCESRG